MSSSKRLWLSSSYRSDGCEATEAETEWGESSATLSGSSKFFLQSPTRSQSTNTSLLSAVTASQGANSSVKLFGAATKRKTASAAAKKNPSSRVADVFARFNASEIALDPKWDVIRELSRDDDEEDESDEISLVLEEDGEDSSSVEESLHFPQHVENEHSKREEDDDEHSIDPMALFLEPSNRSGEEEEIEESFIQYHVSTSRLTGLSRSNININPPKQRQDADASLTPSRIHDDDHENRPESPHTPASLPSQLSLDFACQASVSSFMTWEEGLDELLAFGEDGEEDERDDSSCLSSEHYQYDDDDDRAESPTSPCVVGQSTTPRIGSPPAAPKRLNLSWSNFHDSDKIPTLSPLHDS